MRTPLIVFGAAAALLAAACSGTGTDTTTTPPPPTDAMAAMSGMMGDATATPARDVGNGELEAGPFALLPSAPSEYGNVAGEAALARHDAGTTVTVDLDHLVPDVDYIVHVHTGACADGGGPHYRHDVDGSDMPPNELHLAFTAQADGSGFMTVENDRVANRDAASVVIHAVGGDKIACADLAPPG